jgi:CRP-like cAMP-binding protein
MRSYLTEVCHDYSGMSLLATVPKRDLRLFAATATRLDLPAGTTLSAQGRRHQEFGVVIDGHASVERDGRPVGSLQRGDCFGEFTVLRGVPSPMTIIAATPVSVDVVSGPEFRATLGSCEAARRQIEQALDGRIRDWVRSVPAADVAEKVTV